MRGMDGSLAGIFNFRRLSDRIATSGQPTEAQSAAIARAGFEVVINLAMPDDEDHLPDERATVEALGMTYRPIPVVWESPTHENLDAFFTEMARYGDRQVFVHCVANFRVSTFMFLYRTLVLGWLPEDALSDLHAIWQPYDWWQAFIEDALAQRPADGEDAVIDLLRVHMTETPSPELLDYLSAVFWMSVSC